MILDYSMLPGIPSPSDPDSVWNTYTNNFAARAGALASKFGTLVAAYEVRHRVSVHFSRLHMILCGVDECFSKFM